MMATPAMAGRTGRPERSSTGPRFSTSTHAYERWELADALESIARCGYEGVEILTERRYGPHREHAPDGRWVPVHLRPDWSAERIAAVREQLARLRLEVVCLAPLVDFLQPHYGSVDAEIEEVRRQVDLAATLGAGLVRPYAARALPEGMDRREGLARLGRALRACGEYAGGRGVRLAIENHGQFSMRPENLAAVIEATDHPAVGICLHIPRGQGETDAARLLELAPERVWHVHLAETRGVPVGEDLEELPAVIRALTGIGYRGWWNHEGQLEDDPEPRERAALALMKEVLPRA